MLPGDIKRRKQAVEEVQRTLDRDLQEISERVVTLAPYTNRLFHRTAVEWLAATDQVCNPCCNISTFIITILCSLFKRLNIPSSRSLLVSHLVRKMVLIFQVGKQPVVRSYAYLKIISRT